MNSKKIRNLLIGLLTISITLFGLFNLKPEEENNPVHTESKETQIVKEEQEKPKKNEEEKKEETKKETKTEENEKEQEEEKEEIQDSEKEEQPEQVVEEKQEEKEKKTKESAPSKPKKKQTPEKKETSQPTKKEAPKKEEKKKEETPKTEEKIEETAKVLITDGRTKTILPQKNIPFKEGDTAWDITARALKEAGIQYSTTGSGSGLYVQGINNLYEFDGGPNSGWHIRINGTLIDRSAGAYSIEANQTIHWNYTYDYTKDSDNW